MKINKRLDATTLTKARHRRLIRALLTIDVLQSYASRTVIKNKFPVDLAFSIVRGKTDFTDVEAIWNACSEAGKIDNLLEAIEFIEGNEPIHQRVFPIIEECLVFISRNEPQQTRLIRMVNMLTKTEAIDDATAHWLAYVGSHLDINDDLIKAAELRDLLLELNQFPVDPEGESFPLFVFVDGISGDVLEGIDLEDMRALLSVLAKSYNVSNDGIARLRQTVESARRKMTVEHVHEDEIAPIVERSILVMIEPDRSKTVPPHFFLHIYDWLPWESETMEQAMGSRGRATNPSEVGSSRTLDDIQTEIRNAYEKPNNSELAKEIGRRLLKLPMKVQLVEFVVPAFLICEDFDAIQVDPLGDEEEPLYVSLGHKARVVVRPLARWQTAFREEKAALHENWRERWEAFSKVAGKDLPPCWWKHGIDERTAFASLYQPNYRHIGCFGLGFASASPEMAKRIHKVLLAIGAPVAIWTRAAIEGDVEHLVQGLFDATTHSDLRDRVQKARAEGSILTLFWDDPTRSPHPVE